MCGKGGLPDAAFDLLHEMKAEDITPNAITYNALIHASAGGGTKPGDIAVASPVSAHASAGEETKLGDVAVSPPVSAHASAGGGTKPGDFAVSAPVSANASAGGGTKPGDVTVASPVPEQGDGGSDPSLRRVGLEEGKAGGEGGKGERRWDRVLPLMEEMKRAG